MKLTRKVKELVITRIYIFYHHSNEGDREEEDDPCRSLNDQIKHWRSSRIWDYDIQCYHQKAKDQHYHSHGITKCLIHISRIFVEQYKSTESWEMVRSRLGPLCICINWNIKTLSTNFVGVIITKYENSINTAMIIGYRRPSIITVYLTFVWRADISVVALSERDSIRFTWPAAATARYGFWAVFYSRYNDNHDDSKPVGIGETLI